MNQSDIQSIQTSWNTVLSIRDEAASLFYQRLFDLAPQLRMLFPEDLYRQKIKLMAAINLVVLSLENQENILPVLRDLGRKHAAYGVNASHYTLVGEVLLWTLAQGLGQAWTPELAKIWEDAYRMISGVMLQSVEERREAA